MQFYKGFRFRIYPTDEQATRLIAWEHALRFLWNLALEQRKLGFSRPKGERIFPTAFDQINELTDLRAELPWLADVPRNVCAQLLVELDKATQSCFKKWSHPPRWKRKGGRPVALTESHPKQFSMNGTNLRFPKIGPLRIVAHRSIEGRPKQCAITRDGDQWFACIVCEVTAEVQPSTLPPVGIDVGIVNILATSTGYILPNPRHRQALQPRIARAQRQYCNKEKGSRNREKAKQRAARLLRRCRRQHEHTLHNESLRIANNHGFVAIENMNITGMMRNSHLGRVLNEVSWGKLQYMLKYKSTRRGGSVVSVSPQYTSQTCSVCGNVDAKSRQRRPHHLTFCCVTCGHTEHADINAAKVILQKALAVEPTVSVCGGHPASVGPVKQKLWVVRPGRRASGPA